MKYVVAAIGRGYAFRIAYNLDDISQVRQGRAEDICGSAANAILEGNDPNDMLLRIYFKDGNQATFYWDMIEVYTEDDNNDVYCI